MQDPASKLRRIPLPRTSVNKGKRKGRGCYAPALRMRWVRPSGRYRLYLPPRARASAARAYEQLASRVHEQLARLVGAGGGPTRRSIRVELQLRPTAPENPAEAVRAKAPDGDVGDAAVRGTLTTNTDARACALDAEVWALTLNTDTAVNVCITPEDANAASSSNTALVKSVVKALAHRMTLDAAESAFPLNTDA